MVQSQSLDRRNGFVLVMVLVLITLAGMSLVRLSKMSLDLTQQATAAQEDLQRRWGAVSCERLFLGDAEQFLDAESLKVSSEARAWPLPAKVAGEVVLGGLRFSVLLADEDSKLNLNALYCPGVGDVDRVTAAVTQFAGPETFLMRIRPPADAAAQTGNLPFRTWGEVFETGDARSPTETAHRLRDCTTEITCWGGGRLNIRRASDDAVRALCDGQIKREIVDKLLSLRRETGIHGLDDLLAHLTLETNDRATLQRLLTDRSQAHSLWIAVHSEQQERVRLAIDRRIQKSNAQREIFTW